MQRISEAREPDAVTIKEAANRLSVSYMTVYRMLERGMLKRVRIGRAVRVSARSVVDLIERGGSEKGGVQ